MEQGNNKRVIIISGATATGKTALSLQIASLLKSKYFVPHIINFDSLCFYRELNIGTAKPDKQERSFCPHHLFDLADFKNPLNAADFVKLATPLMQQLLEENEKNRLILVGGSGFYLRALMLGMYELPQKKETVSLEGLSIDDIRKELATLDPESFHSLHPNDHYRNTRALQYYKETGEKISTQKELRQDAYDFSESLYPHLHLFLHIERQAHIQLIERRTKKMLADHLVDEVQNLISQHGDLRSIKTMQSIGYKETLDFLTDQHFIKNLTDLEERISISTRQLAKSQNTIFQKITPKIHYHPLAPSSTVEDILYEQRFL
jgi:tRNA dimethylallyltransferase